MTFVASQDVQGETPVDYILIRDMPGGAGAVVGDKTLNVGDAMGFYAAGYTNASGYVRDVDVDWYSTDGEALGIMPATGTSTNGTATEYGVVRVRASRRQVIGPYLETYTGNVTIVSDIDWIVVKNGSGPATPWFGDTTVAGDTYSTLYVSGYNTSRGYLRDVPTFFSTSNESLCDAGPGPAKSSIHAVFYHGKGTCRITATYSPGVSNSSGVITIVPDVDYIIVWDYQRDGGAPVGDETYRPGEQRWFNARGYNNTLGYLRDVVVWWSSSNEAVCLVENDPVMYWRYFTKLTTISAGQCRVTANYAWYRWNSTGTITVADDIDHVVIRDRPGGGGQPVGARTLYIDHQYTLYAAGYNSLGLFQRDLYVTWSISDTMVCRRSDGSGQALTISAYLPGVCRVTATLAPTKTASTGDLTVINDLDYLVIRDAPGGGGEAVGDRTLYSGSYYPFYAAAYNLSNGFHGDLSATWITDNTASCNVTSGGSFARLEAMAPGQCTVMADFHGLLSDVTGRLTVVLVPGPRTIDIAADGSADYRTIQEGVDAAVNGTTIRVHSGTYREHVVVDKSVTLEGLDPPTTRVNGSGVSSAFLVTADNVRIAGFTIESSEYGVRLDHARSAGIANNVILRSGKGISETGGSALVAGNLLVEPALGIESVGSWTHLLGNVIERPDGGVSVTRGSSLIEGNRVRGARGYALSVEGAADVSVAGNDFEGLRAVISNSSLVSLSIKNGSFQAMNSSWDWLDVTGTASLEIRWTIGAQVRSGTGAPVAGARVRFADVRGNPAAEATTDDEGLTDSVSLVQATITPDGTLDFNPYRVDVDVGGVVTRFEVFVNSSRIVPLIVDLPKEEAPPPYLYPLAILGLAALLVGAPLAVERSRYALLALVVPLSLKFKKHDLLEQFTRGSIYGYVKANPGEHFGAIRDALSLSHGNATYHLRLLESEGLIRSRNDGVFKRFYAKGVALPPEDHGPLSEIQQRILSCLRDAPGISQKEIASLLGMRQSTLEYQFKKLTEAGRIEGKKKVGRRIPYYLVESKEG